jgi:S-DNA-T family DNA segregation ATPase FtsK/SpoIIIE
MTATVLERKEATVPVASMMSMFDPIYVGIDEYRQPVYTTIMYRNLLAGGEPGGGKSGLLNTIVSHAALSTDCDLVLLDGKLVELGPWRDVADIFVGPSLAEAIAVLERLRIVLNTRYEWLDSFRAAGQVRRKIVKDDGVKAILTVIDELALYSATEGSKQEQEHFVSLLRDLVSRGRAAAMPVVAATQRPSHDIIPTSLRDLFGYRAAFRCTTPNSSDIVLGHGWAAQGYSAQDISPVNQGECLLITEGGLPRRTKVCYLTDTHIRDIADQAEMIRRPSAFGGGL